MFEVIMTLLLGVVFAVCATWIAQHVLGTTIGWVRAIILVALVYVATVPVVRTALEAGDVMVDDKFAVSNPMGVLFIAVALGWQFTIAVAAIMLSELFWPSGRGLHPIRAVQEMLRRRTRLRRYAETIRIASKYGINLYGHRRRGEAQDLPAALIGFLNAAGPTFVKVGQLLSTRDDILPREFTNALATLQMQTTEMPWDEVRKAVEAELPGTLEESFSWVDETPLAAASIAQVHRARLPSPDGIAEGASVIIKVQRPDARASVRADSDIIVRIAAQAERRAPWARAYGLSALANEFVRSLGEELDYRIELANTELLRSTLAKSSITDVLVPAVYPELCTERMMVQAMVEGVPFAKLHGEIPERVRSAASTEHTREKSFAAGAIEGSVAVTTTDPPVTARSVANKLVDSVFEQIAVRGVFHADLHPGNIFLQDDGRLVLIDFGSVGILEKSMRRALIALMSAMGAEDDIALTDLLLMIAGSTVDGSEPNRDGLQREIGVILTRVHNGRTDASIFGDVLNVLRDYSLALPPSLVLVFRTISSLEGTVRQLVPDYDMVDYALSRTSYFARLSINPDTMLASAQAQLQVVGEQLRRLPRRIESVGSQIEQGTFGMSLRMFRDPQERSWVGSLIGQVTTTMVGVALIIAAVFLVISDGGPLLTADVSLFSFLGTVLGLAGMLLVLRTLRASLMRSSG